MLEQVRCRTGKTRYNFLYNIGTRWFTEDHMIRIIDRNRRKVTVQDERTKEIYTLSIELLNRKYTRLIPTGLLQIGILQANSKLRMDDLYIEYSSNEESAYSNYDGVTTVIHPIEIMKEYQKCPTEYKDAFRNPKDKKMVSDILLQSGVIQDYYNYDPYEIEEFMETIPYHEFNLKHYRFIMLYFDDTIDTIIPLLGKYEINKYNACLQKVAELLKHETNGIVDISEYMNMKTFLETVNFLFIVDCSNNIINMEFQTKVLAEEKDEASPYDKTYMMNDKALYTLLRNTIGYNVKDIIMYRYWYDIDLSSIANKYTLIRNTLDGALYIFIYNSNGVHKDSINDAFSIDEQNRILSRFR